MYLSMMLTVDSTAFSVLLAANGNEREMGKKG